MTTYDDVFTSGAPRQCMTKACLEHTPHLGMCIPAIQMVSGLPLTSQKAKAAANIHTLVQHGPATFMWDPLTFIDLVSESEINLPSKGVHEVVW
jgi:hypothetical protein